MLRKKIILGDTFEEMSKLRDKSVNLILADLPYGVTANKKDKVLDLNKLWEHYNRIITDAGTIILFAQGLFMVDLINSNRKNFRYDLIWDKVLTSGFLDAKRKPLRLHEHILIFQKYPKKCTYNPQMTLGKPSNSKGTKHLTKDITNNNYGNHKSVNNTISNLKYPKSILSFQKPHPSKALHRTEKPVDLLEWLVRTYSNEGDVVLDNTCGSGGVGVACERTNRSYILIDNDIDYIEVTKKRLLK